MKTLGMAVMFVAAIFLLAVSGLRLSESDFSAKVCGGTAEKPCRRLCPQCKCALKPVAYPGGMLNRDQWESVRAGDYRCDSCPDNGRANRPKVAHFWAAETLTCTAPIHSQADRHKLALGEDAWVDEAIQCKTKAQMVTLLRAFAANMKAHRADPDKYKRVAERLWNASDTEERSIAIERFLIILTKEYPNE